MPSLSATGAGVPLNSAGPGTFAYRLHFTRTSGTLEYEMGRSLQGKPVIMMTGTWVGTVVVQSCPGRVETTSVWTAVPGESYTENDARVLE